MASNPSTFDILLAMADQVVERYRQALRAWATMDLGLAVDLVGLSRSMDVYYERLMGELLRLEGPDAVHLAVSTFAAGRSLERIGDHAAIIGARLALPPHRQPRPPRGRGALMGAKSRRGRCGVREWSLCC